MELKSLITPTTERIGDMLEDNYFFIPLYQRKYEWNEVLIKTLIEDIFDYNEKIRGLTKTNYYNLGTLFYFKKSSENFKEKNCVIVDGQQRLTTIFIILNEIKNLIKEKKNKTIEEEKIINEIEKKYLFGTRNYKLIKDGQKEEFLRLKREYKRDDDDFKKIFNSNSHLSQVNEKDNSNFFLKNSKIINHYLKSNFQENFDILRDFYKSLILNTEFIFIELTYDESDNLSTIEYNNFFENLNLKAKPLNILNLIKNYVYSYLLNFNDNLERNDIINKFEKFDKRGQRTQITDDADLKKYVNSFLFFKNKSKKNNLLETYKSIKSFFNENDWKKRYSFEGFSKINEFLNFFDFLFTLKEFTISQENKSVNENVLKLLWLLDHYFDTFLLIFYKIYTIENKEILKNSNIYQSITSDSFLKYVNIIFKYTIGRIICGREGGQNAVWNNLSRDKIISYDSFNEKINEKLDKEDISFKAIRNKLINNDVYDSGTKNINSAIKFLLFLINNKFETEKRDYKYFKELEIEHIMPQSLGKNLDILDSYQSEELNMWINKIKLNYKDEEFEKFKDFEKFKEYKEKNKEYKFVIKYFLNKISNLTIVKKDLNKKLNNLPFTNNEDKIRSRDEMKKMHIGNEPKDWVFNTKKEVFEYYTKQKINESLLQYNSFSKKSDFDKWGKFLLEQIQEELNI